MSNSDVPELRWAHFLNFHPNILKVSVTKLFVYVFIYFYSYFQSNVVLCAYFCTVLYEIGCNQDYLEAKETFMRTNISAVKRILLKL